MTIRKSNIIEILLVFERNRKAFHCSFDGVGAARQEKEDHGEDGRCNE